MVELPEEQPVNADPRKQTDTIKIDQSFVRKLVPGSDDAAIVRATIGLGHALGLSVIAEGIETEQVAAMLTAEGCDEGCRLGCALGCRLG